MRLVFASLLAAQLPLLLAWQLSSSAAASIGRAAPQRAPLRTNGAATAGVSAAPPTTLVALSTPPLQVLPDAPPRGIFDPSTLATGDAAAPLLMSFSAVSATDNISTHLAVYDAALGAWLLAGAVNAAATHTQLPCAGGVPCEGSLIHEVSTLVGDAGVLRVLCHSYVVTNGSQLHYDWGFIAMYSSPAPAGPWRGEPLLGWKGASPLSTTGVAAVLTDVPALADCLLFTEPGAIIARDGRLLLALGCASAPPPAGGAAAIRIVLLSSADAAARREWAYEGVLVDGAVDAARLGYAVPQLNAAALFAAPDADGGALMLAFSPSETIWPGSSFVGYVGCLVARLNASGTGVERDAAGAPVILRAVLPAAPAFAGACTAAATTLAPAAAAGYLLPTLNALGGFFAVLPSAQLPV